MIESSHKKATSTETIKQWKAGLGSSILHEVSFSFFKAANLSVSGPFVPQDVPPPKIDTRLLAKESRSFGTPQFAEIHKVCSCHVIALRGVTQCNSTCKNTCRFMSGEHEASQHDHLRLSRTKFRLLDKTVVHSQSHARWGSLETLTSCHPSTAIRATRVVKNSIEPHHPNG